MLLEIAFTKPQYLWFLVTILVIIIAHFYSLKHVKRKSVNFANFDAIARVTGEKILNHNVPILFIRSFAVGLTILALSGMVIWYEGSAPEADFVVAVDSSSSMLANDFMPSRFEVAKIEVNEFIKSLRGQTQVGVISFAGVSFVEQDLTSDFAKVREVVSNMEIKAKFGGTNIGGAITNGVNLLSVSEKSKILILVTDGRDNFETLEESIDYAIKNDVIIYTIGIATEEGGTFAESISTLDEEALNKIATSTAGQYFKAGNEEELKSAYLEIGKISKQKIKLNAVPFLMLLAIVLLLFEWTLINTKFKVFP